MSFFASLSIFSVVLLNYLTLVRPNPSAQYVIYQQPQPAAQVVYQQPPQHAQIVYAQPQPQPQVVYAPHPPPGYPQPYDYNAKPQYGLPQTASILDQQLQQMVAYQYQIQLLKQMQQQQLLSNLPEMIKNNRLPAGLDINQLLSLREKIAKINSLNGTLNTNVTIPTPSLPIDGLLKNLGNLLTSVLNGLTGVTGAAGAAAGKDPNDVFKTVEDDMLKLASIKGPNDQPLVNPLNSFLSSVAPVLNTVLGLLGPLGALG